MLRRRGLSHSPCNRLSRLVLLSRRFFVGVKLSRRGKVRSHHASRCTLPVNTTKFATYSPSPCGERSHRCCLTVQLYFTKPPRDAVCVLSRICTVAASGADQVPQMRAKRWSFRRGPLLSDARNSPTTRVRRWWLRLYTCARVCAHSLSFWAEYHVVAYVHLVDLVKSRCLRNQSRDVRLCPCARNFESARHRGNSSITTTGLAISTHHSTPPQCCLEPRVPP